MPEDDEVQKLIAKQQSINEKREDAIAKHDAQAAEVQKQIDRAAARQRVNDMSEDERAALLAAMEG